MKELKNYKDISEFFNQLRAEEYLVLRNFEEFENKQFVFEHPDIDLLCKKVGQITARINCKPKGKRDDKLHYVVLIENQLVPVDIRCVGDNYFDKKWQKEVLKRKCLKDNYYIMDNIDYFYTLLYHSCIHKKDFSKDYIARLSSLAKMCDIEFNYENRYEILNEFLRTNGYRYVYPKADTTHAHLDNVDKKLIKGYLTHQLISKLKKMWHNIKRK